MGYNTIYQESIFEEVEKRSKFISYSYKVDNCFEIQKKLNIIRKSHHSAKHCVYAYRLSDNFSEKYSDDGEPSGTAGQPIMEVIKGFNLRNVMVIIVRYFGGVLLGTGGLRRMYASGAKNVLKISRIIKMEACNEVLVECEYKYYNQICSIISNFNGSIKKVDYERKIKILFYVPQTETTQIVEKINNLLKTPDAVILMGENFYERNEANL